MSGDIFKDNKIIWNAASWLFNGVVEMLAQNVPDEHLKLSLQEIVDENLGTLKLDDFTPEEQKKIYNTLITIVIPRYRAMEFNQPQFKPDAIKHLNKLKSVL